jgi:hypothetical protein
LIHEAFKDAKKKAVETRKEATILMRFEDDRQLEFKQLLEEFSTRARELGGELKLTE